MTPALSTPAEVRRLKTLREYGILDTPAEQSLDDLVFLASQICGTPSAVITLIDEQRLWFKARLAFEYAEAPREMAFCTQTLDQPDLFIVPDARADPRFEDSALVTSGPRIRFYAGAPLISPEGETLGALCVIDQKPHTLTPDQKRALEVLAGQVMTHFEKQRAAEALKSSEARFSAIFRSNPAAIGISTIVEGRFIDVNERLCEMLGWPRAELIGKTVHELGLWADPGQRPAVIAKLRASGSIKDIETRLRRRNGAIIDVLISVERVLVSGEPEPVIAVMLTDLTERKIAEGQLKLLQTCVSRLNDIVLITEAEPFDEPGPRILFVNDAFIRRTGYSREEVIGRSPRFLQGPKTSRSELDRIRASLLEWKPVRSELINYTKNGEEFWLEMDIVPVADSTGWYTHWVAVERDISERRRDEEALRESEERFRGTFEQAAVGIAHVSETGLFLRVNDKLCDIVGYSREELLKLSFVDVTVLEDRGLGEDARVDMLSARSSSYTVEKRYRRKDGEIVWVNLVTTLERAADGQPKYFISVFEDITRRKLAEFRLRRLNRLHTVLSEIGEAIVRKRERHELYEAACHIVVDHGLLSMAYIAELDPATRQVRAAASWGNGLDYLEELAVAVDSGPLSEGTVGVALRTGRHDVCNCIAHDPRMKPWREKAFEYGFHAVASFPLKMGGVTTAALVLFASEVGYFQEDEIRLMVDVANDLSFAMEVLEKEQLRQQAERALRASEEQFSSAFEYAAVGVALVSPEGDFLKVNRALCQMLGYQEEALLQKKFQDIAEPRDLEECMSDLRGLIAGKSESFQSEERFVHRSGQQVWTLLSVSLTRNECGRPLHFIFQAQDITLERQAREALRLSEERFRLLAKATNDAVWDWNVPANTVWWNEGLEALFGFKREEVEPDLDSWTRRIHPDDLDRTHEIIRNAVNRGLDTFADEYRFLRKDGAYAHVLGRGHIIRDQRGQPIRMISGMTDLTERIEAETRIAEQAALIDKAQDAIIVRDLDHRITYWNKSAERLYGWTAGEVLNQSAKQLFHEDSAAFDEAMNEVLDQGDWVGELSVKSKDGREIVEESRWTLVRDQEGQPRSILVINTDITERNKLEQQFLRAQRMESIGTLAGGIAHDLNNVLGPILMSIDLLRLRTEDAVSLEALEIIAASARHGSEMVSQVLSYARGIEGRRVELQLRQILQDIEKIANETFLKHVRVNMNVPEDLWTILGDPTQIHQVALNLCVNARDAMPNGGNLNISAENVNLSAQSIPICTEAIPGSFVCLNIQDTGVGIPTAIIERIFDPFFTTKDVGKGSGLGLSTSLAIVKSHGGFIQVQSEVGKGASFKIYLPAQTWASTTVAEASITTDKPRGNGETVLVVDDEASVRKITRRTLEAYGYRVILASGGAEAVAAYISQGAEIDVVLTDMTMPGMDGPAAIHALRRIDPSVRIIGTSGVPANGPVTFAASLGLKQFLLKPYTADTMLRALEEILSGN